MAYGCAGRLGDGAALTAAVAAAVRRAGLTIVADIAHVYVPHGVTVAALLAQSHVVVSTWPEHRTAVVDMAVCGDSGCATRLWETLTPALLPDVVQLREHTIALLRPVDLESER
jgi:S-adenosylmethionine decarboxylase